MKEKRNGQSGGRHELASETHDHVNLAVFDQQPGIRRLMPGVVMETLSTQYAAYNLH